MIRFFILSLFYLFNARAFCAPKSLAVLAFHNINIDADLLLDAEEQIRTQLMDHLDP